MEEENCLSAIERYAHSNVVILSNNEGWLVSVLAKEKITLIS